MLDVSLKVLKSIEEKGFKAYIVGGFVRDYLLGIKSSDIDISTDATPKELKDIFLNACFPNEDYGSVVVDINNIRFDITTFRKESNYINNRVPSNIHYIKNLEEDLTRRDFTINCICIDSNGKVVDLLNGREDLDKKIINTIGDSYSKFTEDSLRILRAVRFATILNFELSSEVKDAIKKSKFLLKNLSYNRKKEELDKIFASINVKYGIQLIKDLELDVELELNNIDTLDYYEDLIGIWSIVGNDLYPFNRAEREQINMIKEVLNSDVIDNFILYKYGLYISSVAASIKKMDKKEITLQYNKLPIKFRKDIMINGIEIAQALNKKTGIYIKNIYKEIEKEILLGNLINEKKDILEFIRNKEWIDI